MCTRYWPPVKQEETYDKVQVKNLKETSNPHYILREFLVHHEEVRWWAEWSGGYVGVILLS